MLSKFTIDAAKDALLLVIFEERVVNLPAKEDEAVVKLLSTLETLDDREELVVSSEVATELTLLAREELAVLKDVSNDVIRDDKEELEVVNDVSIEEILLAKELDVDALVDFTSAMEPANEELFDTTLLLRLLINVAAELLFVVTVL